MLRPYGGIEMCILLLFIIVCIIAVLLLLLLRLLLLLFVGSVFILNSALLKLST